MQKTQARQNALDEVLLASSRATLSWQSVESGLYVPFDFIVGKIRNPNVISAVWHSVANSNIRLTMLDSALYAAMDQDAGLADLLEEWERLQMGGEKLRRSEMSSWPSLCRHQ